MAGSGADAQREGREESGGARVRARFEQPMPHDLPTAQHSYAMTTTDSTAASTPEGGRPGAVPCCEGADAARAQRLYGDHSGPNGVHVAVRVYQARELVQVRASSFVGVRVCVSWCVQRRPLLVCVR
jgi:hypothetical protein